MRGFCAECGSPIVFQYEGNSNLWILVGSLDYPTDWPMRKDEPWGQVNHWYIESKVSWYEINDGLPQRGEMPPASAAKLQARPLNAYSSEPIL